MVGQWLLVCISLPFPDYCSNKYQYLSLYCIIFKLTTVCLGVLALTDTISVPQNDENVLCRFGIVWLNIWQYQKGGVQPVFLIPLSFIMGCHQEYFRFNQT